MLINKDDLPLVETKFMNEVHFEDVDIINELYESILKCEKEPNEKNKQEVTDIYNKWYFHTVNHFRGEEEEMILKNFPPFYMHKAEHDRVLEEMRLVLINWENNYDVSGLKIYISQDVLSWIVNHIQTMDAITSNFFETGQFSCH